MYHFRTLNTCNGFLSLGVITECVSQSVGEDLTNLQSWILLTKRTSHSSQVPVLNKLVVYRVLYPNILTLLTP